MYQIIIWHQSATEGSHNRIFLTAKTLQSALHQFSKYLQRPVHLRSFNASNKVQMWHDDKFLFDIPAIS